MKYLITLLLSTAVTFANAQNVDFAPLPAPDGLEIFAPGIVSNNFYQRDMAISPDKSIMVYSHVISVGASSVLVYRTISNGEWSLPQILPFSNGPYDIEPFFSPDGEKLYFASNNGTTNQNFDIWSVDVNGGSWGTPTRLNDNINTDANEYYPSIDNEGTLYYTAAYSDVAGEDIWMSKFENGEYQPRQVVAGALNTGNDEFNAFIDPAGSFMLFSSFGRADGQGGGDLYRSNINGDQFAAGVNYGTPINTQRLDFCPFVTPDGDYLFFTSEVAVDNSVTVESILDVNDIIDFVSFPGQANIYWQEF
ncbi:MAG: hypothetical protein RIC80_03315 [Cyclobacteriaceae bacterium]